MSDGLSRVLRKEVEDTLSRWRSLFITALVALAAVLLLRMASPMIHRLIFRSDHARFDSIVVGMTEQEVRNQLGTPDREYRAENAPSDYYVDGYSFKERPIRGSVLIYGGVESIAYVYLDAAGKVEEVFVGGS